TTAACWAPRSWRPPATACWTGAPPASRGPPARSAASTRRCAARPTRSWWSRASSSRATTRSRPGSPATRTAAVDRYCVMGNPVEHSRSPRIHARFAALTGQALEYGKRLVPMDGFVDGVRAFRAEGGRGCNVTVPFKFEAARLADFPSARVALAGACNTLRFDADGVHGENTDGIGLVADLRQNAGVALDGRDLLLVGAGGGAAGVL